MSTPVPANSSTQKPSTTDATGIIELIERDLRECIQAGMQHYTILMDALLEFRQPLTDAQLREYHWKTLQLIQEALTTAYEDTLNLQATEPTRTRTRTTTKKITFCQEVSAILAKGGTRLTSLINKHFDNVYLRKHEIQMNGVVDKIKQFTNQAEEFYREKAYESKSQKQLGRPNLEDVIVAHRKQAEETMHFFEQLLQENQVEKDSFWKFELKNKLHEHLEAQLEEIPKPRKRKHTEKPAQPAPAPAPARSKPAKPQNMNHHQHNNNSQDERKIIIPKRKRNQLQAPERKNECQAEAINETDTIFLIDLLQKDITQCVKDGLHRYKYIMEKLIASKNKQNQHFKDSQLKEYHLKNTSVILTAFHMTYEDIIRIPDTNAILRINKILIEGKDQLETIMEKQFNDIYLRKHEIQIENIAKRVKGFIAQAEMFMDEKEEKFQLQGKSQQEVKLEHERWEGEAIQLFNQLMMDNNFESPVEEFWRLELKQKLREHLEEFLDKCPKKHRHI